MVKPAAKQTVTTYNSHSCQNRDASFHLLFLFSSFPLLFLFFSILIPSSFPSSFHLLFPPHFILYRNPTYCYFPYQFLRSTFYHHPFDVMRLQRYAFIGQMTLLSSKSSGNQDDGGRRDRSAHVNHGTSSDTGAL